ncbi:MAG: 2-amino-4-hydroxy-6-hydroxymethyldihydropteridine diphosphokinase [Leptospiraceae bacterium]|nr:2-amino-4-hydroxy-6-hydroxymethyldihydropteridine diphosphokinase [Leptospiraceae bacterium]
MSSGSWNRVYLSLGSNLGDRKAHLLHAEYLLEHNPEIRILQKGRILENPPMLVEDQPDFLNQIIELETRLLPYDLLDTLKEYEIEIGRQKRIRYGPREIDLDILSYGDLRMESQTLTIPHPALRDRPYLKILLADFNITPEDLLQQATRSEF